MVAMLFHRAGHRPTKSDYDLRWRLKVDLDGKEKRFKRQESIRSQLVRGLVITLLAIVLTVITTKSSHWKRSKALVITECGLDQQRLAVFNLTSPYLYAQKSVRGISSTTDYLIEDELDGENDVEVHDHNIIQRMVTVNATPAENTATNNFCEADPLQLSLRRWHSEEGHLDASHLLFGVASTAERLLEAKDHLGYWLGGSGARLTIAAPDSHLLPWLKYELESRGVLVTIIVSDEPTFLGSYFRLLLWLKDTMTSKTKWVTFLDDDTFFFSLRRFITMLRKYDEEQEYYIGAVSEDGWQMMRSGEFAFGGAGITLSVPLLERLIPFYDRCTKYKQVDPTAPEMGGDLRLARCITRNTPTKLTREKDLRQVDVRGNVRGIIQGPRVPITWHHYRSRMWGALNVLTYARSVPFCTDGDCLFQRYKFYDSDGRVSMLHLGHSFVRYAEGIDPQTSMYELTWDRRPLSTYDHSFEPLRRAYVEGKEIFTYTLEHGQWLQDGSYVQTYIMRADPKASEPERRTKDEVVEFVWRA